MRVLHVPFTWWPDSVGGTEVYVRDLARGLNAIGVESYVCAPGRTAAGRAEDPHGLHVWRYAVPTTAGSRLDLYRASCPEVLEPLRRILEEARPDVVHVHAWTRGVGREVVQAVKDSGAALAFTYHTPTVTCCSGTLMRMGTSICSGDLETSPCGACVLHARGLPAWVARSVPHLPSGLRRWSARRAWTGRVGTTLEMPDLVRAAADSVGWMLAQADLVFAPAEWIRVLLLRNGVPASRIRLSRHGLPDRVRGRASPVSRVPLRLAFVGRMAREKGLHDLLEALAHLRDLELSLTVYTPAPSREPDAYQRRMLRAIEADSRVELRSGSSREEVSRALGEHHLLVVPSAWAEAGPLVILESFDAGVPVLGGRVPGIDELVRDGENGLLVEPDSPRALARVLRRVAEEPGLLERLRAGVPEVRSMEDAVADHADGYAGIARAVSVA